MRRGRGGGLLSEKQGNGGDFGKDEAVKLTDAKRYG